MSARIASATIELKHVFNVLAADVEDARSYGSVNPSGFAHRNLLRAYFALLEGLSFQLRRVSLECARAKPGLLLSEEFHLLSERRCGLDEKGLLKHSDDFQKVLPNMLFSMRCYAKVHGTTFEPDTSDAGYGSLVQFIKLRNGLEHPKYAADLEFTDEQLRHAVQSVRWWKGTILKLLEACSEADAQWKARLA